MPVLSKLQQWIRTCLSIACILIGIRLFEVLRIFRGPGILAIVFGKMLRQDVVLFFFLLAHLANRRHTERFHLVVHRFA